jgi:hypothetical protein
VPEEALFVPLHRRQYVEYERKGGLRYSVHGTVPAYVRPSPNVGRSPRRSVRGDPPWARRRRRDRVASTGDGSTRRQLHAARPGGARPHPAPMESHWSSKVAGG